MHTDCAGKKKCKRFMWLNWCVQEGSLEKAQQLMEYIKSIKYFHCTVWIGISLNSNKNPCKSPKRPQQHIYYHSMCYQRNRNSVSTLSMSWLTAEGGGLDDL